MQHGGGRPLVVDESVAPSHLTTHWQDILEDCFKFRCPVLNNDLDVFQLHRFADPILIAIEELLKHKSA